MTFPPDTRSPCGNPNSGCFDRRPADNSRRRRSTLRARNVRRSTYGRMHNRTENSTMSSKCSGGHTFRCNSSGQSIPCTSCRLHMISECKYMSRRTDGNTFRSACIHLRERIPKTNRMYRRYKDPHPNTKSAHDGNQMRHHTSRMCMHRNHCRLLASNMHIQTRRCIDSGCRRCRRRKIPAPKNRTRFPDSRCPRYTHFHRNTRHPSERNADSIRRRSCIRL
jgi:hypothetical protein